MKYTNIDEVIEANKKIGGCWFAEGNLQFFNTVLYDTIYNGNQFITRETDPLGETKFSTREILPDSRIRTINHFCFETYEQAEESLIK